MSGGDRFIQRVIRLSECILLEPRERAAPTDIPRSGVRINTFTVLANTGRHGIRMQIDDRRLALLLQLT